MPDYEKEGSHTKFSSFYAFSHRIAFSPLKAFSLPKSSLLSLSFMGRGTLAWTWAVKFSANPSKSLNMFYPSFELMLICRDMALLMNLRQLPTSELLILTEGLLLEKLLFPFFLNTNRVHYNHSTLTQYVKITFSLKNDQRLPNSNIFLK